MKRWIATVPLVAAMAVAIAAPRSPIPSGVYTFRHKFAEQPNMLSFELTAKIHGRHITLINDGPPNGFPRGVIAEGELMWHAKSRKWIIGRQSSDRYAKEVGGCTDGPEVVDLRNRIYWTC